MRRIWIGLLLAGMYLLTQGKNVRIAQAQAGTLACGGHSDTITFPIDLGDGTIGIEVLGEKLFPEKPIIIGQDESHIGVNLWVRITALEGKAVYWREHIERGDLVGTFNSEAVPTMVSKGLECIARNNAFSDCYEVNKVCRQEPPEPVYRYINPESVSIWLDPTRETEEFLGWGPNGEGRYPLRFIFPEKWALGAWTPTGMEQEEIGWNPTDQDVWAFGQENPWFTYLFPDPNETDLPGQHLLRMSQPVYYLGFGDGGGDEVSYISRRVLGLYGSFFAYQSVNNSVQGTGTGPLECLVDSGSLPGDQNTLASEGSCTPPDGYNFGDNVTEISIYFKGIPLDLPGHWRIGIKASQYPAKYDHVRLTENVGRSFLSIGPADYGWTKAKYVLDDFGFDSYVIISTPCYGTDPKSCVN